MEETGRCWRKMFQAVYEPAGPRPQRHHGTINKAAEPATLLLRKQPRNQLSRRDAIVTFITIGIIIIKSGINRHLHGNGKSPAC